MAAKKARKRKPKPRFIVEFELIDAPGQLLRVDFPTKRRALYFVNFDDDNDLICYATLLASAAK